MNLRRDPTELATTLLNRSTCSVMVGAVLVDRWGVFSWGHNNPGNGYGEHAEQMCMRRANRNRVEGATLYIAAVRRRNGKIITAKPCLVCQRVTRKCQTVVYRDGNGIWRLL